ncbi:Bifunctional sesterterpene synthase astC-like protein [Cladobotryum mycophilum]|uniref:Bifunctional sesterterpene synthase astC-like protein n=1 Tax=Cladobotryum mycophilum TaxID=491253 RepID=A0ABR0T0W2_9HYPO
MEETQKPHENGAGDPLVSRFQPKISRFAYITDDASLQCQIDLVGKEYIGVIPANFGRRTGNCIALSYPHCLPERLATIAYAVETGFIHDDIHYTQFTKMNSNGTHNVPQKVDPRALFKKRSKVSLSKLARSLERLAPEIGRDIMTQWETWQRNEEVMTSKMGTYRNFEEFMADRLDDIAAGFYTQLVRFAGNITLTDEEEALVAPIIRPLIFDAVTLTNDYFSFDKEYAVHLESGGKEALANQRFFQVKPSKQVWQASKQAELIFLSKQASLNSLRLG